MILAMIGDYLLGYKTFSTSSSPEAYMGITWNVVPDWRYATSSILGFMCAALFAVGAVEVISVLDKKYKLGNSKLFKLFKIANWAGILYFAFIHIGICMLPVVFNAGMEVTYYKEFYNRILCLISVITLGLLIISDYESGHENNKKEG